MAVVLYANARVFSTTSWLLHLLKGIAPDIHKHLSDPIWRTGINPSKLKAFLQSDELDEVAAVKLAKENSRRAGRLLANSARICIGLLIFAVAVGTLAVALGSTDIRLKT